MSILGQIIFHVDTDTRLRLSEHGIQVESQRQKTREGCGLVAIDNMRFLQRVKQYFVLP